MKTRYLFTLVYLRQAEDKKIRFEEHIVAETWQQARDYWNLEFVDEGVEIEVLHKQVPILAVLPGQERTK